MPDKLNPIPVKELELSQQIAMIMGKYIGDEPLICVEALKMLSENGGLVEVRFDAWKVPMRYDGIPNLARVTNGTPFFIEEINYIMPGTTKI